LLQTPLQRGLLHIAAVARLTHRTDLSSEQCPQCVRSMSVFHSARRVARGRFRGTRPLPGYNEALHIATPALSTTLPRSRPRTTGGDLKKRKFLYGFFEAGETRSKPEGEPRNVRVGAHGLTATSKATLWQRLTAHRGSAKVSTGNHRGSIFRLLIGDALRRRDPLLTVNTWGVGSHGPHDVRLPEVPLERIVSEYVATMPFVWLTIDAGKTERSSNAMRSHSRTTTIVSLQSIRRATTGWVDIPPVTVCASLDSGITITSMWSTTRPFST